MKKLIFLLIVMVVSFSSCKKDDHNDNACSMGTTLTRSIITNPVSKLNVNDSIKVCKFSVQDTTNLNGYKFALVRAILTSSYPVMAFTRNEYFVFDTYNNVYRDNGTYYITDCGKTLVLTNNSQGRKFYLKSTNFDAPVSDVTIHFISNGTPSSIDVKIKFYKDRLYPQGVYPK